MTNTEVPFYLIRNFLRLALVMRNLFKKSLRLHKVNELERAYKV